ncbi:hypothetical protein AUJ29_00385 [Candidatus Kuenenbacteria bacterium CG1_02_38_13]|uniref:Uncharacterized protein n=1 Tax=Candidatus Kuenenbacteria bacterium CG1_02_38_13 TaxID=1805235 RepID=A0A1J4U7H0_9BACT|nr:MAG: hypothetical protein AUJ29_00385 [Candidatus Kuenenbacteria bacterium CG1_02_38_13]
MKNNNHMIYKSGLSVRSQIVFTTLLILGLFLLNTGHTDADIFAERTVRGNAFTATTLDFSQRHSANNSQLNLMFNTQGYLPEGFDLRGLRIKKEGKMDFRYRIKTVIKNGDTNFCNSLSLQLIQNWQAKYQGRLVDLNIDAAIPTSGIENWIAYLNLENNDARLKNKTCEFDFVFKAYRTNPDIKTGFWAEKVVNNNVSSGTW